MKNSASVIFSHFSPQTNDSDNSLLMKKDSKPNLLFVVHRVPFPPDRGDRIRSYHVLKFLASRANVWLACLADEPLHPDCKTELQSHCQGVQIEHLNTSRYIHGAWSLASGRTATEGLFYSHRLMSGISKWCREVKFDAAIGFCSSVAPYLKIPQLQNVPKLIDLVDVDSEKFADYSTNSSGIKSVLYNLEAKRLRSLEISLGEQCQGVTLVTEPEADIYRSFAPGAQVRAATNGIDLDFFDVEGSYAESKDPSTCLFVGALNYPPNIDGIKWFCNQVWPTVIKEHSASQLLIVGRNPTPDVQALGKLPGVKVFANVPDVRPYYHQASVSIAPLHLARGLQNKVLEALAMKTAVLSTPHAVEGIGLETHQVMIASDPSDWSRALINFFRNHEQRNSFAEAGYQFVRDRHCWSSCLEPVAELLGI